MKLRELKKFWKPEFDKVLTDECEDSSVYKLFTKEQAEELEKEFWNLIIFGENAYKIYDNGKIKGLSIEEIEKLKELL